MPCSECDILAKSSNGGHLSMVHIGPCGQGPTLDFCQFREVISSSDSSMNQERGRTLGRKPGIINQGGTKSGVGYTTG